MFQTIKIIVNLFFSGVRGVKFYILKPYFKVLAMLGGAHGCYNMGVFDGMTSEQTELNPIIATTAQKFWYFIYELNFLDFLKKIGTNLSFWLNLPLNIIIWTLILLVILIILFYLRYIFKTTYLFFGEKTKGNVELGDKLISQYLEMKSKEERDLILKNEIDELKKKIDVLFNENLELKTQNKELKNKKAIAKIKQKN